MSGAPARGASPRRLRRHHHHHHHHHHHQKHQKQREESEEPEEKRPKVNPIFLWASQREQRIVEVRCEDYDKRNRIKLTKTAQGWRSIPRTASNMYTNSLGVLPQEKTTTTTTLNAPIEDKEKSNERQHVKFLQPKDCVNGRTNCLVSREDKDGKRRCNESARNDHHREYSFSDDVRNGARVVSNWEIDRRRVPCSEDDDDEEDEDEEENQFQESSEHEQLSGRTILERLQKSKLFQPRVVLEQLHLSQLPESVHKNILSRERETTRSDEKVEDAKRIENEVLHSELSEDNAKRCRPNKAGIQDILNMIDATASPVLATDTPNADLPSSMDSTKTFELVLNESSHQPKQGVDQNIKEFDSSRTTNGIDKHESDRYQNQNNFRDNIRTDDFDRIDIHEEKVLENYNVDTADHSGKSSIVVSSKNTNFNTKSCKIVEADGGLGNRPKSNTHSFARWQTTTADNVPLETEEEAPDEPGDPIRMNYNDSSKILDALRNTPGLSISLTRTHTPESTKTMSALTTRPSSKASSSSRSPDSQAECVERLLKNSVNDSEYRRDSSPKNLPGLSIVIPNYRYRNGSVNHTSTHSISPNVKLRVESPESTVNFPKNDSYSEELKLRRFMREEDDEEREMDEEEEDDCDSQVLEDLRRQKADSLAYEGMETEFLHRPNSRENQDDRKSPQNSAKTQGSTTPHWISSSRSSEAQAKCKYQDLEHFDEQVLEELRSRGTVVSPQPSGIPFSPASRRPSSTYLERLLPSPPCSVSCSEDAKNDLTLKGILASPSHLDARDQEKSKDPLNRTDQIPNDHPSARLDYPKDHERSTTVNYTRKPNRPFLDPPNIQDQGFRSSRPLSSGDIHSTYYVTDRSTLKRPLSVGKRRPSIGRNQKFLGKDKRTHDHQEICATSSSTDQFLDPASQLRELIETSGHFIPDPLLVPRDCLPALAAAPATEIPKLLTTRPELRLPEALTRPDLLRDPDLLVISLAHLQHVLDHGEGPVSRSRQSHARINNGANKGSGHANNGSRHASQTRPKLSCKPIGTLMPAPIDLSNNRKINSYPPLLRVRTGLLKQEPEVSSTANSPDDSQLWHPLFGSQKRQQPQQSAQHHASWHRTTLAS